MKVLVTGASGYIGRQLAERLSTSGYDVSCMVRDADFWRVERAEATRTMLLRAEMKLTGKAWLQFDLTSEPRDRTRARCCAWFHPRGLAGERGKLQP